MDGRSNYQCVERAITMSNIFLDCGTHFGQGLDEFITRFKIDSSWKVFTFEANPITHNIYKEHFHKKYPWVTSYNLAVSNKEGVVPINLETVAREGHTGQGTSLIDLSEWNPHNGIFRNNYQYSTNVNCINFSNFIKENCSESDYVLIKLDIEGSEYDVLESMIDNDCLKFVDHLVVEWHSHFFINKNPIIERENKIKKIIESYDIILENWK